MASSVISSGSPSHGSWGGVKRSARRSTACTVWFQRREGEGGEKDGQASQQDAGAAGLLITQARCYFIHVEQQWLEDLGERDVPAQPQGEGAREEETGHTRGMHTVEGEAARARGSPKGTPLWPLA